MKLLLTVCRYLLIVGLGGLLLCTNVYAEDEAEESVLVPWPMRLEATWWDAFSKADTRQLQQKVTDAQADLAYIKEPESTAELAQQVSELFSQYYQKRTTPLPITPIDVAEEKAQYSLAEVQQLVSERRKAESELQLMQSNLTQLDEEFQGKKAEVVAAAIVYKRLQNSGENNLLEGLDWLNKQLSQALLSLNNSVLDQQLKDQQSAIEHLKTQEALHIERLVVLPETKVEAEREISRQELIAESHRSELERLKTNELTIGSDTDEARTQRIVLGQNILAREAALRLAQGKIIANQTIIDIASFDQVMSDEKRDIVREHQKAAEDSLKALELWLDTAQDRVRQEEELLASIRDVAEKSADNTQDASLSSAALVERSQKSLDELNRFAKDFELLMAIVESKLSMSARGAEVLVEKADDTIRHSWKTFKDWMVVPLFSINNTPVDSFGVLNFLLIMFVGWLIARLFRKGVTKVSERSTKGMQASSVATLSRIFSVVLLGIALLVGFSSLGIDVTKLALVASALSIGIGFGLQNIINNFVSGVILLFERSMKVGDYIELPTGVVGEVREINIRSTVVTTNSNIDIIVPNSEFVNNSVTNWTMSDSNLRIKLPFTVAYGCDKERLREVVLEAVLKQPYTLNIIDKHYPQLRLSGFGDNALNFDLVVWIKPGWSKRPGRVKAAYNWVIDDVLREHHFEIPFPQRDVHIKYENKEAPGLILPDESPAPQS
ncbi:mechanosensitive ion channel domain-containing protein [Leucothrix pacifica]|uniref:Mechanosensitive ion channel protein MscS n=1 Tax=Leucothrix pacifica TaxID=1247513 RepID=A0A317CCH7_9GAMM|nr:mechanosensitive ion channel domain-containing protein [Leucothrix pacifica]PWQ95821.1 hypothetical protein DKW60_14060 [Leucothrix pacifica]